MLDLCFLKNRKKGFRLYMGDTTFVSLYIIYICSLNKETLFNSNLEKYFASKFSLLMEPTSITLMCNTH